MSPIVNAIWRFVFWHMPVEFEQRIKNRSSSYRRYAYLEEPCAECAHDADNGLYYGQDEECPH